MHTFFSKMAKCHDSRGQIILFCKCWEVYKFKDLTKIKP